MPALYAWARGAFTVIELGVRSGNSTSAFLAGLEPVRAVVLAAPEMTPGQIRELRDELGKALAGPAVLKPVVLPAGTRLGGLWSVDVAEPEVPPEWRDLPFWHLLVADDRSGEAVAFCPDQADVLFIDTSHERDHTLAELRLYGPKVRPGGVILLHDTDRAEWPGVGAALDEWCAETGLEWYDHPFHHGLGVVEIPCA